MSTTRSFSKATPALLLPVLVAFLILGLVSPTLAFDIGGFGGKSAGTYLDIEKDAANILQINQDGNLSFIFSSQFSGGDLGAPFSNTLGSWKRSGKRELTAKAVDLTFKSEGGQFVGVGAATYVITFDKKFRSAFVTCEGAIYPPGVNPFDPKADPIDGSEFSCGDEGLEFHRLPAHKGRFNGLPTVIP